MIVMVGTARGGAGGVASVIAAYEAEGLFRRWPMAVLESHVVGARWRKLRVFLLALLQFIGLLLTGKVELVHLHTSAGASFWRKFCFASLSFLSGKPVILHLHSGLFVDFYQNECGALARRAVRHVLEHSARVIALAPSLQAQYARIAPRANIICIPNALRVSMATCHQHPAQIVLFMGQISAHKGVFDLIQAWKTVSGRLPRARLIIAGEGDVVRARHAIESAGLQDSITLPGWVTGASKEALLSRTQVCVLPSYFEGMPMSLIEAFGLRIPCVATNVGGIPDILTDGVEGRLIEPGDVSGLAGALVELLTDDTRYAQMSKAAHDRYLNHFSMEVVMPRLEQLYAQYVAPASAPAMQQTCGAKR